LNDGTTPTKGATHTHASLAAQCDSLAAAWEWRDDDLIYHALPLHHIHGIVNAWMCAHYVGARVEFGEGFSPRRFWSRTRDASEPRITVFMGVPTMYVMLLRTLTALDRTPGARETAIEAVKALRLTVSGSAACPVPTQTAWRETTGGDVLLERYGMTEIGMALSNPLRGTRTPGAVGTPLPGVEVKIVEEERAGEDEEERRGVYGGGEYARGPGELLVRGPGVFDGYWNDPEKTRDSFDDEGYFRTGDTAAVTREGAYVILGRTSVDVFNTGGHKVSALEIEAKLLEHPEVREVAVVGLPDDAYGEIAAAIVVLRDGAGAGGDGGGGGGGENVDVARVVDVGERERDLRAFCAKDLASHKVPRTFVFAEKIPRNAMGKVNKKTLRKAMFPTVDFSA
jgi:malonyl-CoA/methylmalonyl-CoA synthetase